MLAGFWKGFWAPLHALKMIATSPRLLTLTAIPLTVNVLLYILFFRYGADELGSLNAQLIARMSTGVAPWLVALSAFLLKVLSWLLLALVAALTFTFISGLISAPFNDHLSRAAIRIRLHETGAHVPGDDIRHPIGTTIRLELKRILTLVVGGVIAAILGLIPFLQLPALGLGALLVSFEYFGYPVSHRSPSLLPVARFTLRHPFVSLGFGSFLLLVMALPFTSIFYIPLAVVGGTILYADLAGKVTKPALDTHKKT